MMAITNSSTDVDVSRFFVTAFKFLYVSTVVSNGRERDSQRLESSDCLFPLSARMVLRELNVQPQIC